MEHLSVNTVAILNNTSADPDDYDNNPGMEAAGEDAYWASYAEWHTLLHRLVHAFDGQHALHAHQYMYGSSRNALIHKSFHCVERLLQLDLKSKWLECLDVSEATYPALVKHAVVFDQPQLLRRLLAAGAHSCLTHCFFCIPNHIEYPRTLLAQATHMEAKGSLRELISARADLDAECGDCGATALYIACDSARVTMVRMLLEARADPNVEVATNEHFSTGMTTPISCAVRNNDLESTRLLLDAGVDAGWDEPVDGLSALIAAMEVPQENMIALLEAYRR